MSNTPERCGGSGRLWKNEADEQRRHRAQGGIIGGGVVPCPGCPDCQPERCPTCGSDDPARDHYPPHRATTQSIPRQEIHPSWRCPDPFHDPPPATPDTSQERGDCGVCGVPASTVVQVTPHPANPDPDDFYGVPRCKAHVDDPPYQAEVRLEQAASTLAHVERELREARAERLEQAMGDVQHGLRRGHLADLEVVAAILASDPRERASGYDANPAEMGKAVEAMIADPQLQNPESPTAEQAGTEVESSRLGDRPEVDRLVRLAEFAERRDAVVSIVRREGGGWQVTVEWGREAPDSPMVGAASYGDGETLEEALAVVLSEIRA